MFLALCLLSSSEILPYICTTLTNHDANSMNSQGGSGTETSPFKLPSDNKPTRHQQRQGTEPQRTSSKAPLSKPEQNKSQNPKPKNKAPLNHIPPPTMVPHSEPPPPNPRLMAQLPPPRKETRTLSRHKPPRKTQLRIGCVLRDWKGGI